MAELAHGAHNFASRSPGTGSVGAGPTGSDLSGVVSEAVSAEPKEKVTSSGVYAHLWQGKKVLIVDDSPTVTVFTKSVLLRNGYVVETADNIWISSQVSTFHPDLILMDVHLGASLGTAAVSALRNRTFTKKILLVLYSTLDLDQLEKLAAECGADGIITKRSDPDYLLRQVRRCFIDAAITAELGERP